MMVRKANPIGLAVAMAWLCPGLSLAQAQLPFTLDLRPTAKQPVSVRYTPGSLDRASHVQTNFSVLALDFAKWSGKRTPLRLYLLSREDWEGLGGTLPYGVPARLPSGEVMLSAWGDPGTVVLWRRLLGTALPSIEGSPLRGTAEQASSLVLVDLFGQVEACRALLALTGYSVAEPWIVDLSAHTLFLSSSFHNYPAQLAAIDSVFASLLRPRAAGQVGEQEADMTRELSDWLRRQAEIHRAARTLLEARGGEAAKALLKLARKKKGSLGRSDLKRRFPELGSWLAANPG